MKGTKSVEHFYRPTSPKRLKKKIQKEKNQNKIDRAA